MGNKITRDEQAVLNEMGRAIYLGTRSADKKKSLKRENPWLEDNDAMIGKGLPVSFEVGGKTIRKLLVVKYRRELAIENLPEAEV